MAYLGAALTFPLGGEISASTTCWNGDPSEFEVRLMKPLHGYALEQLRARLMSLVVPVDATRAPTKAARTIFQMALETETRAVLTKLVDVAPDVETSNVCERRRYLDVDYDMRMHRYLVAPAFDALSKLSAIPPPYVDLIRRYGRSAYPRYRVSAFAVTLCLAAAVGA